MAAGEVDFSPALEPFAQARLTQIAPSGVRHRHHSVRRQLFRWLLLRLDRLPDKAITMTRDLIAQTLAHRLLLQQFSPAAVLVKADGDVLFINGRTGTYLEPATEGGPP